MTRSSRRRILQGIAVTLPATWSRPVVESLVLPAHAQTSPVDCNAAADCYEVVGLEGDASFQWPGGAGPFEVDTFNTADCSGPITPDTLVVASDAEEAADLLTCEGSEVVFELDTNPSAPEGCSFFACAPDKSP